MTTTTFSVLVGRSTKSHLERLAKNAGRSRSFLAAEAISAYLDTNERQLPESRKRSHRLFDALGCQLIRQRFCRSSARGFWFSQCRSLRIRTCGPQGRD
jgi:hypothetical protein